MEKFQIPKEFECFGETVIVKFIDNLLVDEDAYGLWNDKINIISIQNPQNYFLPPDKINLTFFHELIHCVLDKLEYKKLSEDEAFVERVGAILYQVFKTAKYEKD